MTRYKDAETLQDEIEAVLDDKVDGVTVYRSSGEIDVHGVTDSQMDRIHRNVNPEVPVMQRNDGQKSPPGGDPGRPNGG